MTSPVRIGGGTFVPPIIMGSQDIGIPKGATGPVEVRNAPIFNTCINGNFSVNEDPSSILRKVIGRELSNKYSANVYLRCRVNSMINDVGTETPDFVHLRLPAVNAANEFRSISNPANRSGRPKDGSNWLTPGNLIGGVATEIMSGTRSERKYSSKTDFETRKENQDFGYQNISMSRPPLESTPLGINTTNGTTTEIDSIPVENKTLDPAPQTVPTDLPTLPTDSQKGKETAHVPAEPKSDPSLSEFSSQNLIHQMTAIVANQEARTNLIQLMTSIPVNSKARNTINRKTLTTKETGLVRIIVKQFCFVRRHSS